MNTKEIVPRLVSAVAGAIVLAIVGFSWGDWYTASQADAYRNAGVLETRVAFYAPSCVDSFMAQEDAAAKLKELKKKTYGQVDSISADWRMFPGDTSVNTALGQGCLKMLKEMPDPAAEATNTTPG